MKKHSKIFLQSPVEKKLLQELRKIETKSNQSTEYVQISKLKLNEKTNMTENWACTLGVSSDHKYASYAVGLQP